MLYTVPNLTYLQWDVYQRTNQSAINSHLGHYLPAWHHSVLSLHRGLSHRSYPFYVPCNH